MKLLSQNSKLKKDGIFNFAIPAYKSMQGELICIKARYCIKDCYAKQGTYQFLVVRTKHEANYQASKLDDFHLVMIKEIKSKRKCKIVRIHDSGDFYSREYAHKWLAIIEACPDVLFYAYSKNWHFFEGLVLPKNFRLIQSQGGINSIDESRPHAKVFSSLKELKKAKYADASYSDLVALKHDKVGLVYHGNKKASNKKFINGL